MYDINKFGLKEMTECGMILRNIGSGAKTMEETANRIVRFFCEQFTDNKTHKPACVLARLFKTHPYRDLDLELQRFADGFLMNEVKSSDMKCLTLLATAGDLPEWSFREKSSGHKAIPLASEKIVSAIPMIANLIRQLGLEINQVVKPNSEIIMDIAKKKYNVFFVPNALGNSVIPSQENFVVPFGVKSVIGFGGIFPSGNLFAVILFTRVHVPQEVADLFKTLALNVKLALLSFEDRVFKSSGEMPQG